MHWDDLLDSLMAMLMDEGRVELLDRSKETRLVCLLAVLMAMQ